MWDIYSVYTTHIVFKSSTKEALLGYMVSPVTLQDP